MNQEGQIPDLSQLSVEELRRLLAEEDARLAQAATQPVASPPVPRRQKRLSRKVKLLIFGIPLLLIGAVIALYFLVSGGNWSGSGIGVYSLSAEEMDKADLKAVEKMVRQRIDTSFSGRADRKNTLHFKLTDGSLQVYLNSQAVIDRTCALLLMKPAVLEIRDDTGDVLAGNQDLSGVFHESAGGSVYARFNETATGRLEDAARSGRGLEIYLDGELVRSYAPQSEALPAEWGSSYQLELVRFSDYNYANIAYADLLNALPLSLSVDIYGSYSDSWSDYLAVEEAPAVDAPVTEVPVASDAYANLAEGEFIFQGQVEADRLQPTATGYTLDSFSADSFIVRYIYNSNTDTVHDVVVEINNLSLQMSQTLSSGDSRSIETTASHFSESFSDSGALTREDSLTLVLGDNDFNEVMLASYGSYGFSDGYISYAYHNDQAGYDLRFSFLPILFYNITAPGLLTEQDQAYIATMNAADMY